MTNLGLMVPKSAFAAFFVLGVLSAATVTGDLSKYREFQLGTDLPTIAKQTGVSPSEAKTIHSRPALIQELEWRPQPLTWSPEPEAAQDAIFSFYSGRLFRIVVNYDPYKTEGLTTDDIVEAISLTYGVSEKPPAGPEPAERRYGDQEEVVGRWQNAECRFDLIRSSYGPSFSLVGVLKRLEAPAQTAILEAQRLDEQEAPQREAARIVSEEEAAKGKLQKARLVNKPIFRP
jgi:hypothetical protein